MLDTDELLPVTIPTWPACEDCLSWSEDYLAVAGGEIVHILISKNTPVERELAGHPQWKISSLRVNLFRQDEWVDQHPVTVKYLSIGEEQSLSLVVALAWSPLGLGVHRRAVLAILTSNLILSLWETDGNSDEFERTYIFNKYLSSQIASDDPGVERQKSRIRAFAWLPPVKTRTESKWGLQHILVADDSGALCVLRVVKEKTAFFGHWRCEIVLHQQSDGSETPEEDMRSMSPLQRRLYEQTPVTKINVSAWEEASTLVSGRESAKTLCSKIEVRHGLRFRVETLVTTLSADGDHVSFLFKKYQNTGGQDTDQHRSALSLGLNVSDEQFKVDDGLRLAEHFKEALQPLQNAFNATNQLYGHYRVRFWGTAMSSDYSQMAACVTIHPSDMIEYTIPSSEKCTLVFTNIRYGMERVTLPTKTVKTVYQDILRFALVALQDTSLIKTHLDRNILLNYYCLSSLISESDSQMRTAWDHARDRGLRQFEQKEYAVEERRQNSDSSLATSEKCDVCGAAISLTPDTSGATCLSGHYFSRCQISFLAIQEPGVSKYCARCGKQFLSLAKLEALDGPCLTQAMFDEFDVCPFCQGKFRG